MHVLLASPLASKKISLTNFQKLRFWRTDSFRSTYSKFVLKKVYIIRGSNV